MISASAQFRKNRWRGGTTVLLGAVAIAIVAGAATAQETSDPWPEVNLTEPENKRFEVRNRYHYRERIYDPEVLVKTVDAPLEHDGHPETIAISHISAMKNLDYEWWLGTFDADSQEMIKARDAAAGRTIEDRVSTWQSGIKQAGVTLVRWIETGQQIIVTYRLSPVGTDGADGDGNAARTSEVPLALHLSEGRWTVTLDLEEDPVFLFFDSPSSVVERVIR